MTVSTSTTVTVLMGGPRRPPHPDGEQSDVQHADQLVRHLLDNGGKLVRTGDETLAAIFQSPSDAVSAILAVQRGASDVDTGFGDGHHSRLVLHSGPIDLDEDTETYPLIHEARALFDAGRDGQILLSGEAASRLFGSLPEQFSLCDLGEHGLDDGGTLRQVFELIAPGQEASGTLGHGPSLDESNLIHLPYVGRERELSSLRDALGKAMSGEGQVVLITGDPGVGKTRTAEILCADAREQGASIRWGTSFEGDGAPAYWPWTQVLRDSIREATPDLVDELSGDQADLISHVLPEIREGCRPATDPAREESTARFYRLLTAIGTFLRAAAERDPLVIVLDDIHWSDTASLQLLRFVAQAIRHSRILLIATYREMEVGREHAASPILSDLDRAPHCRRISLKGMSRPLVEEFVTLATGVSQHESLIDSLCDETGGNPFFVTEVVRSIIEDSDEGERSSGARRPAMPASIRHAVGERIAKLSPECASVLTAASVIGREVDLYLLEHVSGVPLPRLLDILDEPARGHLITTHGDRPTSFRFSHSLVKDALYQETSPSTRAHLHLAVAEALESRNRHREPVMEVAHHYYKALPLAEPSTVVRYAERAGHAEMSQFAWSEAATQFERALAMLDRSGATDPARRCDLLLALGEARNRSGPGSGDAPDARECFGEAFQLARELNDAERMARGAIGFAGLNIVAAFGGSQQVTMLEQALDALGSVDCPLRVHIMSRLAVDLWHRSPEHLERSRELSNEAVEMATRLGDDTLVGYALWARHAGGYRPSNLEERIADSDRLAQLAERTGDPTIAAWGCLAQVCDYVELGYLSGAEESLEWLRQFDERISSPFVTHRVSAFSAAFHLMKGRYVEAMREIERTNQLWQSEEPPQHQVQPFILGRDLGKPARMPGEIRLPDHLHSWRRAAQAHRMALAIEHGELEAARADYEALVDDNLAGVPFNRHWYVAMAMIADAAIAFQDKPRAARLIDLLEPYADRIAFDGPLFIGHGPVSLYLGRLASMVGEWERALTWLDQAQSRSERLGLQPYTARSVLARAETLATRGAPGDLAAAGKLAERALSVASEIGMHGLTTLARELRKTLQDPNDNPFGLTRRELDVLRLVAQGMTDAEVAERLYLSPRTVSTHLTSIYGKLNVSSRTAATRVAAEHNLS